MLWNFIDSKSYFNKNNLSLNNLNSLIYRIWELDTACHWEVGQLVKLTIVATRRVRAEL